MKKTISLFLAVFCMVMVVIAKPKPCGTWKGKNLYKGEKGGCYYLKSKKKVKVYVDKNFCKC